MRWGLGKPAWYWQNGADRLARTVGLSDEALDILAEMDPPPYAKGDRVAVCGQQATVIGVERVGRTYFVTLDRLVYGLQRWHVTDAIRPAVFGEVEAVLRG